MYTTMLSSVKLTSRSILNIRSSYCSSRFISSTASLVKNSANIARTSGVFLNASKTYSTEAVQAKKAPSPKVAELVHQITLLNLIEAAELVEQLKSQLNLPETSYQPAFASNVSAAAAAPAAAPAAAKEEVEPEKPIVSVQLDGFDEKNKIKVIKEVKGYSGLGLKEAKTLVESAPKIIVADVKRADAVEMVRVLTEAGAKVSLV